MSGQGFNGGFYNRGAAGGGGGGGGATAWTDLTDTPASITANQFVKGNSGGTALEFGTINTFYEATAGASGADFTTVSAAFTAGNSRVLVIDDTNETSDITIPATGGWIHILGGTTLDINDNQFQWGGVTTLTVEGNGILQTSPSVANTTIFNTTFSNTQVYLNGITIDNNATASGCHLGNKEFRINQIEMQLPNQSNGGINTSNPEMLVSNVHFVGGGTTCSDVIGGLGLFDSLYFEGTYNDSAFLPIIRLTGGQSSMNNLLFNHLTNTPYVFLAGVVSNFKVGGSQDINVQVNQTDTQLVNFELRGGNLILDNFDDCQFTNINTTGTVIMVAGNENNKFVNCRFESGSVSIIGDRNKFIGVEWTASTVNVTSGSDDNSFTGCMIGSDTGSNGTLNINAGANRTVFTNLQVGTGVTDNGNDTVGDFTVY